MRLATARPHVGLAALEARLPRPGRPAWPRVAWRDPGPRDGPFVLCVECWAPAVRPSSVYHIRPLSLCPCLLLGLRTPPGAGSGGGGPSHSSCADRPSVGRLGVRVSGRRRHLRPSLRADPSHRVGRVGLFLRGQCRGDGRGGGRGAGLQVPVTSQPWGGGARQARPGLSQRSDWRGRQRGPGRQGGRAPPRRKGGRSVAHRPHWRQRSGRNPSVPFV